MGMAVTGEGVLGFSAERWFPFCFPPRVLLQHPLCASGWRAGPCQGLPRPERCQSHLLHPCVRIQETFLLSQLRWDRLSVDRSVSFKSKSFLPSLSRLVQVPGRQCHSFYMLLFINLNSLLVLFLVATTPLALCSPSIISAYKCGPDLHTEVQTSTCFPTYRLKQDHLLHYREK